VRHPAAHKVAISVAVAVVFASGTSFATGPARFPGARPLLSPNGLATVYSIPPADDAGSHRLLLQEKADNASPKELLKFGRHVDASWSPDSKHIAVTDYLESNEANCYVIDLQTGTRINLAEKARISGEFASSRADQHRYIECGPWKSTDTLTVIVRAWGDANPKGVVQRGVFSLSRGFVDAKGKSKQ
jgi:hypothetical protein